jgi:phenylacetate-CoA ligase
MAPQPTSEGASALLPAELPAESERVARLNELLSLAAERNAFQRARLGERSLSSIADLPLLPITTKDQLLADQAAHPPYGTNLTFELERYTHLHQTSGTTGATLCVLDTDDDWAWWRRCLGAVYAAAGVSGSDRVALAYSFGPYIQFWASYEGALEQGALVIPLGGMNSVGRLLTMREHAVTTLACTPTYALRLARVAGQHEIEDALASVERIICAGEPGASLPAIRERIESAWGARCFDHAGLSEVGAFTYPCDVAGGLHVREDEFLLELLRPGTDEPAAEDEPGELVVTALGRRGFPVIRYRTGDMAERAAEACPAGHVGAWLPGGILGRTDDMVVIRGMNVFPSAIEQILRESEGVGEFSIAFYTDPAAMDEVKVEVELARPSEAREIQARLRQRLGLRVRIVPLKPGILGPPRGKARRVVDLRPANRAEPPVSAAE